MESSSVDVKVAIKEIQGPWKFHTGFTLYLVISIPPPERWLAEIAIFLFGDVVVLMAEPMKNQIQNYWNKNNLGLIN